MSADRDLDGAATGSTHPGADPVVDLRSEPPAAPALPPAYDLHEPPFWLEPFAGRAARPGTVRTGAAAAGTTPGRGRRAATAPPADALPADAPPADAPPAGVQLPGIQLPGIQLPGVETLDARPPRPRTSRRRPATSRRGAAAPLDRARAGALEVADRVRDLPPAGRAGVAAAAFFVVLLLVLVVRGLSGGNAADPAAAVTASPSPTAAKAVRVPRGQVKVTASSTQARVGSVTYDAANTLDGKRDTAWNSNGDEDGPGEGITLTYTFAEPVDLRTIAVANGYQKTLGGTKPKDLYTENSRLRRVTVTVDDGSFTWDLRDTRAVQSLTEEFGTTGSVTLTIVTVYPGAAHTDVGVSEVAFSAVPPQGG